MPWLLIAAVVLVILIVSALCSWVGRKTVPIGRLRASIAELRHLCLRTLEQYRLRVGPLCPRNERLVDFALSRIGIMDGPTSDPDGHFDTCKACEELVRKLADGILDKKSATRTRPSAT